MTAPPQTVDNQASAAEVEQFLDALWIEKGLSDNTLSAYRRDLLQYRHWVGGRGRGDLLAADAADLQAWLGHCLRGGRSPRSSARMLSCLRGFYRYQLREGRLQQDPTAGIDSPGLGRPLPRSLSERDVELLLAAPDTSPGVSRSRHAGTALRLRVAGL